MTGRLDVAAAAAWLLERDGFLILTHLRPDGDTLGSGAALCRGLRRLGKRAWLLPNGGTSRRYLPWVERYFAPAEWQPEHVIAVDTASEGLFPPEAAPWRGQVGLAVDHHPSQEGYAEHTLLRPEAAACGQIVFDLLGALGLTPDREEADLLYIAVATDTGCFSYGNTDAESFRIAGLCAGLGADVAGINKEFFRTKSPRRMAVEGEILHGMRYYAGGKIALVQLPLATLQAIGADEDDLDSIAAIPVSVEGVLVGATLRELEDGEIKASLRSGEAVDSCAVCRVFGGGGHKMAAGCTFRGVPLAEAARRVVAAILETNDLG